MTGFLRRSLLQAVAAVVLFASAGASDVFAATSYDVGAVTYGNAPKTVVAKHYRKVTQNGMQVWVQVPVNPDPNADPPNDGLGYFSVPLYQTTLLYYMGGQPYNQYEYGTTLTNRTPGQQYKVDFYLRTGASPNYTYTSMNTSTSWTQP